MESRSASIHDCLRLTTTCAPKKDAGQGKFGAMLACLLAKYSLQTSRTDERLLEHCGYVHERQLDRLERQHCRNPRIQATACFDSCPRSSFDDLDAAGGRTCLCSELRSPAVPEGVSELVQQAVAITRGAAASIKYLVTRHLWNKHERLPTLCG